MEKKSSTKESSLIEGLNELKIKAESGDNNLNPESPKDEAANTIFKTPENSPKKNIPNTPKRKRKKTREIDADQIPIPNDLERLALPQNIEERREQGNNNRIKLAPRNDRNVRRRLS